MLIFNFQFFWRRLAPQPNTALLAFGFAGGADISAVEYEPMVGNGQEVAGEALFELFLGLQRGLGTHRKPNPARHPENVRIHRHYLSAKEHRSNHIGGLAPHAWEPFESLDSVGHHTTKFLHQHTSHLRKVFGFVVGVGDTLDVGVNLLRGGCG